MEEGSLRGKTAVVTGASSGIGRAIAISLAGAGASVALLARRKDRLAGVRETIVGSGGMAECFETDVADPASVAAVREAVAQALGSVSILVNNAGTTARLPIEELAFEGWQMVLQTNLSSAFLLTKAFVGDMKGQNWGRVISIASNMAHISLPARSAYAASKTGLLGFTRTAALEFAPYQITVNTISPGHCATELTAPLLRNPETAAAITAGIPLGRWGKPEEVASLARYLCSDGAAFITGTDILMDGGYTAR